jgi:sugar lactone lactonase YvrE
MKNKILIGLSLLIWISNYSFSQTITLSTDKIKVAEGQTITITATLSAPSTSPITINFSPSGAASNSIDYQLSNISTVAGGNGGGNAVNQLNFPTGVAIDSAGNIYVADGFNHQIQKWAPGASFGTTVAGGNGQGSAVNQLNNPSGVAIDAVGNIYVADRNNHRIQKWAPGASSGITVAGGNGDGPLTIQLFRPSGVAIDATGNIYVADDENHRIQKWASGASFGTTVAGGNGQGSEANQLSFPFGISIDAAGNYYIADRGNNRIQKWAPGTSSGVTVAGGHGQGSAADQLNYPSGVAIDAIGNIYVADLNNYRIQKWVQGAYSATTVAGGSRIGSAANQFNSPYGVTIDAIGNIYVADRENHRIQKWTQGNSIIIPAGQTSGKLIVSVIIDTFSENDETIILTPSALGGSLTSSNPLALVIAAQPVNIFLSTNKNSVIEGQTISITATLTAPSISQTTINLIPSGTASNIIDYALSNITTVAGAANSRGYSANKLLRPTGVTIDAIGNIYVADSENHRIQKWAPGASSGTTVAGGNGFGFAANQLNYPDGVAIDATGNIYVADRGNHRIQKWAPGASSGTTVAGGNGQGSAMNQLSFPTGVAIDAADNIYIADKNNARIQKWAPGASSGKTIAGGNGQGPAVNQFNNPSGVAIDTAGNIYVVDQLNHRIQKWTPLASFGTTVAGGNGSGIVANQLNNPSGIAIDLVGNIFVTDELNHRIQKWAPGASLGTTEAGGNGFGSAANQLSYPSGVAIDANGSIYVADTGNARIQKWVQSIIIPAGTTSGTLVIKAIVDATSENDETIILTPTATGGSLASSNPLSLIITAQQSVINLSPEKTSFKEGQSITITATLSAPSTSQTTINFAPSGTAQVNIDFQFINNNNQIIIPAGQTSGTLVINAIVDATSENDETIILTPTATGGSLASNNPLSLIITAQQSVINLSPEKTSFKEGQSTTINATLSAPSTSQTIINFAPSGTAQINIDFQFSNNNNQIIIPAGQTSGTLAISALFDPIINESDETIILTPTAIGGILASNNPLTLFILNVPDSDNDGITDDIDKCQGTPSGIKVDTFGCSDAQKDTCSNVKPTMILKNGLELSTPLIGVGYVWYLNEIKIPNANTSSYLATSSGRYSVQVLKTPTCITGLSENIFVQITGTNEENDQFIVFPNPFTKDIKIEFPPEYGSAVKVSISDIKGSIVYSQEQVINGEILNLSNFSTGTYFLTIYSNHSSEKRVFKLLKE